MSSIKKVPLALLGVAALCLAGGAQTATATPLAWATDYGSGVSASGQSSLYQVDFGASTATLIGGTGFGNVTGLALSGGGTLFGVDHATDQLITLNTATGAGTVVGALGVDVFDVGLAFDGSGNLYLSSDNGGGNDFYSVNSATGAATLIGATGTSGVVGLDVSSTGVLFGLVDTSGDALVTINTATGVATLVGALGVTTNTGGIGFDGSSLYGAFGIASPGLTTINPATGSAGAVTDVGIAFAGLAMQRASVPEPASLALLGLGLLGLRFGSRRIKA